MFDQDDFQSLAERVTELESLFSHSQRLVEQLDEIVRAQETRLTAQLRRLEQLHDQLERHEAAMTEGRRLEDDKPPHY